MVIGDKGVVENVNWFRDAGSPVILDGDAVIHQTNPSHGTGFDQVMFDQEVPVRQAGVIDELDAIFPVTDDLVASNDNIQPWSCVIMQANLDPIIPITANKIIFN